MDLTTRCPKCGTVFQATLSDLQLRKGYIRCVQCAHIFDGYAEVVSDAAGDAPVAAPVPAAPPTAQSPARPPESSAATAGPQVIRTGRPAASRAESAAAFHIGVAPWPDDRAEPRIGDPDVSTGPRPVEEILADGGWVPDAGGPLDAGPQDPPAQAESFVVEARPGHRSQGGSAAPLLQDEDALSGWDRLLQFCRRLLLVLLLCLMAAQA